MLTPCVNSLTICVHCWCKQHVLVIVSTHVAGSAHVNKDQTRFSMSSGSVNII